MRPSSVARTSASRPASTRRRISPPGGGASPRGAGAPPPRAPPTPPTDLAPRRRGLVGRGLQLPGDRDQPGMRLAQIGRLGGTAPLGARDQRAQPDEARVPLFSRQRSS